VNLVVHHFFYANGTYDPTAVSSGPPGIQGQRDWKDVLWVWGTIDRKTPTPVIDMGEVFDGGVAYEYGARGGHDFELYTGGSLDPAGNVGTTKACGYGGCGIDNLQDKLSQAMEYVNDPNRKQVYQPSQVNASSNTATNTTRTCPQSLWTDIDWSPIESRYTFAGYEAVQCPSYATGTNPYVTQVPTQPPATAAAVATAAAASTPIVPLATAPASGV